jgi:hypothetical protein
MEKKPSRTYIGMQFKCCKAYARIYLNVQGTAFCGHCPKCAKPVRIKVSPGGAKSRFWSTD